MNGLYLEKKPEGCKCWATPHQCADDHDVQYLDMQWNPACPIHPTRCAARRNETGETP